MNWVLIRLICCFPTMWLLLHVITSPCDYFSMVSPRCIQCPQGSWDLHFLHRRVVPTGGSLRRIPKNGILVASRRHKDQRQQRRGKDGRKGGREKVISSWFFSAKVEGVWFVPLPAGYIRTVCVNWVCLQQSNFSEGISRCCLLHNCGVNALKDACSFTALYSLVVQGIGR